MTWSFSYFTCQSISNDHIFNAKTGTELLFSTLQGLFNWLAFFSICLKKYDIIFRSNSSFNFGLVYERKIENSL